MTEELRILLAWLAVCALIALLAGCEQRAPAADGYRFAAREGNPAADGVVVRVVEHGSTAALRRAAPAAAIEPGRELYAFALLSPDGSRCTIHVVRPETDWQPEWLGHEAAHCLWGRWHP